MSHIPGIRWMTFVFSSVFLIFFSISFSLASDFYRYMDKNGVLRYTNNLVEVPPEQRAAATRYREFISKGAKDFNTEDEKIRPSEDETKPEPEGGEPRKQTVKDLSSFDETGKLEKMGADFVIIGDSYYHLSPLAKFLDSEGRPIPKSGLEIGKNVGVLIRNGEENVSDNNFFEVYSIFRLR